MKQRILILLLFSLTAVPVFGQPSVGEHYPDIDLYHGWQEVERRDSVYFKAHRKHIDRGADTDRAERLRPYIKDEELFGEYLRILELRGADFSAREVTTAMSHAWREDTSGDNTDAFLDIADRAAQKNDPVLEEEALSAAFTEAFWRVGDYDKAFYIGFRLEERLSQIPESRYPFKRETYYKLGEAYYLFLDFHKSVELLEKALAPVPLSFDDRTNLDALNILGICHANIGRMDTSDEYFRATLLSDNIVLGRPLYNAYALAHLGCNAMLRGQYDKALALSETVWPVLREKTDDYGHLAGMCYCRGRSYLEKGDFKKASVWIDSLVYFSGQDQYNRTKRVRQSYLLRADYFTAMGDARQAKVYNDSLVAVYKNGEEFHTSQYIARASQRYNGEEIADREARLRASRTRLVLITVVALLAIVAVAVILSLYRKKNAAYKALAQRAREWVQQEKPHSIPVKTGACGEEPTDEDRRIIALADREMMENYTYREAGITLDSLSERLNVNRNKLSAAINRCAGGNFSKYVNNYRISEAVRIISQTDRKELYIDELYECVGFNTRSSFYRAFKHIIGLSPIEFQKNRDLTELE